MIGKHTVGCAAVAGGLVVASALAPNSLYADAGPDGLLLFMLAITFSILGTVLSAAVDVEHWRHTRRRGLRGIK